MVKLSIETEGGMGEGGRAELTLKEMDSANPVRNVRHNVHAIVRVL